MNARFSLFDAADPFFKGLQATEMELVNSKIPASVRHLMRVRVSQINACDFCLNMHLAEARNDGEKQERLDKLVIWRETDIFTPQETSVLAWAEALTHPSKENTRQLPELHANLLKSYDADTIRSISYDVALINAWNRVNIGAHNGMEH
ncbi:carboxymuconolactone decarboxylase family protein [Polycladidibacter stylochi]|uniref:carboxymuconolactone decarboxylase family protein n=1 Tax=Polycladidibacter stylochi TaxID=1807766 RepID=UPI000835090C|nr:carboxymuconolactone decarboxylase family protein [Pseudovibrio stylochi]